LRQSQTGVLALDLAPETAPDVAQIAQDAPQAPAPDNAPLPDQATMPAPKQDKLLDPPVAPDLPQTEPDPTLPDSESEAVRLPDAPAQPEVGTLPDSPEPSDNPPEELAEPETQVVVTEPEVGEPEIAEPQVAALETAIPEVGLSGEVGGVVTNRLPRIGDAPVTDSTARQDEIFQPEDSLPLAAYARPFESEAGKPRFAILLMDIGAAGMARDELSKLPFAVTFVIDPAAPDAAQAAQDYRAAGQEVVILATKMPEGATPADLEQSFQAMALILPETVAVLDAPRGGLQENRLLATQAIPILKAQGRAIVAYDRGLGAVNQVAERDGLAHALIFRDLDADGEDTPVIRRYLDRAAFKAAQEGQVLVIGQTRPETVAALLEWMVEGRAASVQLAPLTAVLGQN
jgi:polysaccharide deacetylase 2 family uncharacterized protein YibQ